MSRIGEKFAQEVRGRETARRLWVSGKADSIELWLLTTPIEADEERAFFGMTTAIYDRFPDALLQLHLLNPRFFPDTEDDGIVALLPTDADEVKLRTA